MQRIIIRILLFCAISLVAIRPVPAINIAIVPIGNPGNANDPATGSLYGGVAYNYRIGKYDVTVDQYTDFLNAVAATDTYGLYSPAMATDFNIAGIAQSGASGSYSYSVIGSAKHPVTYVSWGDAARFSNWLHNGQPTGTEGPATTETGAYTLNGAITQAALNAVSRNAGAKWVIPSESEWYKAAFYDPVAGHYWKYAIGSDATPSSAPPGNVPNTANYFSDTTGYVISGSKTYSSTQNYLTDVGAYTASTSPYGVYDANGDVIQWNETLINGSLRGARGGSWANFVDLLLPSSARLADGPTFEVFDLGFRVASVPEPSTGLLAAVAIGLMWCWRKRPIA